MHFIHIMKRFTPINSRRKLLKSAIGDPPTVILGPGQPEMAHQTDEFSYVEKISAANKIFEDLMVDWQQIRK